MKNKTAILYLDIAKGVKFTSEMVTEKSAFLGRTGGGKTYAAMKAAEEMLKIGAQIVVLDPVGKWHGLRTAKNGGKGFSIPVFGGLYGDLPLESTSGILIADLIVDKNISAVIDVSQFETDTEKNRFASEFAARLYFRKKANPSPLHFFVEECEEFIPQNQQKGEEKMLHNFKRIWKLGRNCGIGGSLISQRPQDINKKVLNQSECLFVFQMTAPHEKKAILEWVKEKASEIDIIELLPKLQKGECWFWSPSWLNVTKKIKINQKDTIDISATPKMGDKKIAPRPLSSSEIEEIKTAMEQTIQRVKENDPAELKKIIADLQRQMKGKNNNAAPVVKNTEEINKLKGIISQQQITIKEYETKNNLFSKRVGSFSKLSGELDALMELCKTVTPIKIQLAGYVGKLSKKEKHIFSSDKLYKLDEQGFPKVIETNSYKAPAQIHAGNGKSYSNGLGKGERAVLIALAQFPNGLERSQITVLTQYKRSSRDAYLQRLKEKGFTVQEHDKVFASPEGIAYLGNDYKPLPTGKELQQHWLNTLPQGEKVMLELILDAYPNSITREELSEKSTYQRSSRDAYLQRMLAKEIIETINRGEVKASETLFE